jgi:hypothetical protein
MAREWPKEKELLEVFDKITNSWSWTYLWYMWLSESGDWNATSIHIKMWKPLTWEMKSIYLVQVLSHFKT